jgi:Arc/MetJ family transcription regulator
VPVVFDLHAAVALAQDKSVVDAGISQIDILTSFSHINILDYMRTTLHLPAALLDEARTALGFRSKTDTVVHALREVVRRSRADELRTLVGRVEFEFDPTHLRKRDRERA